MKDKELVKMFIITLKRKEIILFLLIVVINELICIDSDMHEGEVKGGSVKNENG